MSTKQQTPDMKVNTTYKQNYAVFAKSLMKSRAERQRRAHAFFNEIIVRNKALHHSGIIEQTFHLDRACASKTLYVCRVSVPCSCPLSSSKTSYQRVNVQRCEVILL